MDILDAAGAGKVRLDLGDIEHIALFVLEIGVGELHLVGADSTLIHVVQHVGVGLHIGGLGAHLDRHIADGHAACDVQLLDVTAGEVDGFIHSTVSTDAAQNFEDDVLGVDALLRLAVQTDFDDLRHTEPQLAGHQDGSHIGGAAAGTHRTESTVGGGVAVGGDHDHARVDDAGFRHDLMADAAVGVKVEAQVVLFGKLAHLLVVCCALDVGAGGVVVKDESRPLPVPDLLAAHLVEGIDRLEIEVVDLGKIDLGGHDLAGVDLGSAAVLGQDFFDGVHGGILPFSFLNFEYRIQFLFGGSTVPRFNAVFKRDEPLSPLSLNFRHLFCGERRISYTIFHF